MGNKCCVAVIEAAEDVVQTALTDEQPQPEAAQTSQEVEMEPVNIPQAAEGTPQLVEPIDLFAVDHKKVSKVPFENQVIDVRVFKVYDGDTCSILFAFNNQPLKTNIRILHIDCPELHPKGIDDPELKQLEAKAGQICRDFVAGYILDKLVKMKFVENDKYGGRILAEVFIDVDGELQSLSDLMIQRKYARPYQGEKKEPWTKEELTSTPFV